MFNFQCVFCCEYDLKNTLTVLGKNYSYSGWYIYGRIQLTDINYNKYENLSPEKNTNGNESKTTTDPSAEEEFKTYDPNDYSIRIRDNGSIIWCFPLQNHMSAIAAVDFAMRETKPSCGLVKEFKIIPK